jgi:hypothetical protein
MTTKNPRINVTLSPDILEMLALRSQQRGQSLSRVASDCIRAALPLIDAGGRRHARWLNMMYPRLYLTRNLLREDGVILISIDDNEQANLKALCDLVVRNEILCVFSKKHPSGFSVYRTTALCQPRIKALGKKYVEPSFLRQENPRPMLGYFDLSVSLYWKGLSSNTTLHHAPDPHPRHYNVYGMPIPAAQLGHELNLRQTMTKAAKLFRF